MVVERIRKGFSDLFSNDRVSVAEPLSLPPRNILPLEGEERTAVETWCSNFVTNQKELTPENFNNFVKNMISLTGGTEFDHGVCFSIPLESSDSPTLEFRVYQGLNPQDIQKGKSGSLDSGQIIFERTDLFKRTNKTTIPTVNIEETIILPFIIHYAYSKEKDTLSEPTIARRVDISEDWQPPTFTSVLDNEEIPLMHPEESGYYDSKDISCNEALEMCAKAFDIYKKARP